MKMLRTIALLVLSLSLGACAVNRESANFEPNRDLVKTDIFFVERFTPDKRDLNRVMADRITARGFEATAGEKGTTPDNATVLVTYVDKWMWDLTNYMIELTITFRDSESGVAYASGNSYHTSLTRLSPEEMIDEVLTNIFDADKEPAE